MPRQYRLPLVRSSLPPVQRQANSLSMVREKKMPVPSDCNLRQSYCRSSAEENAGRLPTNRFREVALLSRSSIQVTAGKLATEVGKATTWEGTVLTRVGI